MISHHPPHDSCSPDLARDLEVTGADPEELRLARARGCGHAHAHAHGCPAHGSPASVSGPGLAHAHHAGPGPRSAAHAEPPAAVHAAMPFTVHNAAACLIARSHQVPVIVLLAAELQPGAKALRRALTAAAEEDGLRWVCGFVDVDTDATLAAEFAPPTLPVTFAVADGTAIGSTATTDPEEVVRWARDAAAQAAPRLTGLPAEAHRAEPIAGLGGASPGDTGHASSIASHRGPEDDPSARITDLPQEELGVAAEAVARGDYRGALNVYDALLTAFPDHPALRQAHAAVSVLERASRAAPRVDPIRAADLAPEDPAAALSAADAEVVLDQPVAAVERLAALAHHREVRARLLELLWLLPADHPVALRARSAVASALF